MRLEGLILEEKEVPEEEEFVGMERYSTEMQGRRMNYRPFFRAD